MGALKNIGLIGIMVSLLGVNWISPALSAQKTVEQHIKEGKEFLEVKKIDQALASFTEALKLDRKSIKALLNRGNAYCKKGEFDKAISDYNEVIRLDPENGKAYNNRAVAYWSTNEPVLAQEDLKKAESLGIMVNKKAWQELIESQEKSPINPDMYPPETLTGVFPFPTTEKPKPSGDKR
jgi:tetratricopeptide (TPR) repeat protein